LLKYPYKTNRNTAPDDESAVQMFFFDFIVTLNQEQSLAAEGYNEYNYDVVDYYCF